MPDIDDDDTLSEGELDMLDLAKRGELVDIDLSSAQEVERANRLIGRGLVKTVGAAEGGIQRIQRVAPGETPPTLVQLIGQ